MGRSVINPYNGTPTCRAEASGVGGSKIRIAHRPVRWAVSPTAQSLGLQAQE